MVNRGKGIPLPQTMRPGMIIEFTDKEITFLKLELDYKLKTCNPLGYPTSNSAILPLAHAEFYNGIYKKITGHDHADYLKYKNCLI